MNIFLFILNCLRMRVWKPDDAFVETSISPPRPQSGSSFRLISRDLYELSSFLFMTQTGLIFAVISSTDTSIISLDPSGFRTIS